MLRYDRLGIVCDIAEEDIFHLYTLSDICLTNECAAMSLYAAMAVAW